MNAFAKYTLFRLAIFVGTLGLLAWAGASALLALGLAAVISALLSYLLLRPLRDQVAANLAARTERRLARGEALSAGKDAQIEDAAIDGTGQPAAVQPVKPVTPTEPPE